MTVNVRDFGAVGDGVTDDDAAADVIQASNTLSGNVTAMVGRPPSGAVRPWGDGQRWTQGTP
jgi:hypothetical protein